MRINYCNIVEVKTQECMAIYKLLLETFRDSVWLENKKMQKGKPRPDSSKSQSYDGQDMMSSHLSVKNLDRDSQRRRADQERLNQEYLVPRAIKNKIEKEFDQFNRGRIDSFTFLSERGKHLPTQSTVSEQPRLSTAESLSPSFSRNLSEYDARKKSSIKIKYGLKHPEVMTVKRTDGGSILRVKKVSNRGLPGSKTQDFASNLQEFKTQEQIMPATTKESAFTSMMGPRAYRRDPEMKGAQQRPLDSIHEDSRSQEHAPSSRHASMEPRPSSRDEPLRGRVRLPARSIDPGKALTRSFDHSLDPTPQKYTRLPQVIGKGTSENSEKNSADNMLMLTAVRLPENNSVGPLPDFQETDIPAVPFFSLKIRKASSSLSPRPKSVLMDKITDMGDSIGNLRSTKAFSVQDEGTQTESLPNPHHSLPEPTPPQVTHGPPPNQHIPPPPTLTLQLPPPQTPSVPSLPALANPSPKPHHTPSHPQTPDPHLSPLPTHQQTPLPSHLTPLWPLLPSSLFTHLSSPFTRLLSLFALPLTCLSGDTLGDALFGETVVCAVTVRGRQGRHEGWHGERERTVTEGKSLEDAGRIGEVGSCVLYRRKDGTLEVWESPDKIEHKVVYRLDRLKGYMPRNHQGNEVPEVNLDQMLNANEAIPHWLPWKPSQETTWICWDTSDLLRIKSLVERDPDLEGQFLIWLSRWNLMLSDID